MELLILDAGVQRYSGGVCWPDPNSLRQDRLDAILLFVFVGLGFGIGFSSAILYTTLPNKSMGQKHSLIHRLYLKH
jgi:hypothetical protein